AQFVMCAYSPHTSQKARCMRHPELIPLFIDAALDKQLYSFLRDCALQTPGLYFHEIGGIEDHVHLVVSVPPTLLISDWIGQMKGSSSHYINHRIANRHLLDWQTGYGVVSFGTGDLPWVVGCVRNQRQHHAKGTTQERLERGEAEADPASPLKRAAGP
ncbi:MAG: transposase, partial [Acidobacteria bacterium]|nr:transposase [Acidobacteriota bacterium]MCI0622212.1 transposase [Acidobacteriota bacterium]MCI0720542.1 transposase [Acidobacteriota bacterium]